MVKISIVKVENPSCLWGRVFGGSGETTEDYADLQTQMNLFYHDVTQDLHSLKPASFEEGQVYVVYWALKKSWCRAVVLSIIRDPTCLQTLCFLVDHGEVTVVPSENMRVASEKFLKLPFWVRKFHLSRVQPTTLRVSFFAEKSELKPSAQWDCSATLYLHNLLQASVQTEVVLHEWESESTAIELFVTIGNIKICVNDDLVAKKFAYYSSSGLDACDRAPLPCSYSILTPTLSKCSHKQTEQNLRSPGDHGAESYSWPAVARGCNTFIISQNADQPLGYLVPLLTHLLLNSVHVSHASSSGPIAVLLCPGWEKAQLVYDLLEETNVSQTLHPLIMLVGIGKDQAKDVKIPKNCLLLVTTPFSFVRLLSSHCFLFLRLYHLLLDEADELFTRAPDQMESILQHFQKVTSRVEKGSCPRQLIAAARRWSSPMEKLISCHMPNPYIVISVLEEAALYGNIQQVVLMTPENNKISVLLDALDFCPDVGQKTLIVANSAQEVEDVFQALSSQSAFCLKVHEGLLDQLDFVLQQWKKTIGPRTHIVLVSTSECLKGLGIRDASCVVHFGFPSSPRLFGSRLFCMVENFQNLSVQVLPLYIKTASVYYGRLVNSSDEGFESMASEINSYYADTKPGAKELLQGALYAVQEDGVFHRVKILSVPDPGESLFNSISVRFVDIGKEVEVKSYQVLELPEQFHSLPHQAVEIVVCGVKPVDAEMEWHPKVTRAISQKIRGLQHQARVVLSLGNTLFVHHMVRVTKMAGTRALINEYSLQSEILKTGMGVSNPEHLDVLRELLQDSVVNQTKDGGPTNG
ncbi:PREDICTED: putative ATP-dependent RNA helicase TDRD12 [Cyprinodon variegatus]|uniref:putative ATP-dependent RNA helicase TDRD12 n=1 Tax=Cyprinodon variegatus TaxID=28743 RepID=UPI000742ABC1|nr:PREDICTED: putative ATP-dependent RNA helicase TDRD12 [Cyprinodon variegatus]